MKTFKYFFQLLFLVGIFALAYGYIVITSDYTVTTYEAIESHVQPKYLKKLIDDSIEKAQLREKKQEEEEKITEAAKLAAKNNAAIKEKEKAKIATSKLNSTTKMQMTASPNTLNPQPPVSATSTTTVNAKPTICRKATKTSLIDNETTICPVN